MESYASSVSPKIGLAARSRLAESDDLREIATAKELAAVILKAHSLPENMYGWRQLDFPPGNAGFVFSLGAQPELFIGDDAKKQLIDDFREQHDDTELSAEEILETALIVRLDATLKNVSERYDVLQWDIRYLIARATELLPANFARYSIGAIAQFDHLGFDSVAMLVCAGEGHQEQQLAKIVKEQLANHGDNVRAHWLRTGLCIHLYFD